MANGAVLQLDFGGINVVAGLVTNGISAGPGVYNSLNAAPYITGTGSLQVVLPVTVATNPTNLTSSVSGTTLSLAWPADHIGWRLLVQTNNLAAGVSSNTNDWTTVPGTTGIDHINITINPAMPSEFYRLVYP